MSAVRDTVNTVVNTVSEADRAWLGVATALALYAGKKIMDAVLPRGSSFRFMDRYIRSDRNQRERRRRRHNNDDEEDE